MNLTLLTDLDDTLISTNMDQFFPRYFSELGDTLKDLGTKETIRNQVHYAVHKMEANQDPGKLLSEIFAKNFYLPLGTTEEAHRDVLMNYYREEYPKLETLTSSRPEAADLIEWCVKKGITVAILTNPVFPDLATRARVEWAGLDPDVFPFYTTYDTFHFTKPSMSYYAECLGRMGWPEGKVVMIGDDVMRDIEPTQAMGFPTFQIHATKNGYHGNEGTISDVKEWLQKIASQPETEHQFSPQANIAILRSTPAVFDYWLRFFPEESIRYKATSGEWNLTEIIWHLADLENEVYLPQWRQITKDPSILITAPDTSRWADERDYRHKDPIEAYQRFYSARMASLEILDSFITNGLQDQTVQHAVFSQTTIAELIAFASRHDRIHLRQAKDSMNI